MAVIKTRQPDGSWDNIPGVSALLSNHYDLYSDPSVKMDENGLFAIKTDEFYFAEADATAIGAAWNVSEFTIKLYDNSKTQIASHNLSLNPGNYQIGEYGVYCIGNLNNQFVGNRVLRFKITDESVKYASVSTYNSDVSLKGVYWDKVPQPEIDGVDIYDTYLEANNAADFARKMSNYSAKYKKFKGIYRREQDGDIMQTINTGNGRPAGHNEAAHYYKYYDTEGDFWLYLYDIPTALDNNIAYKGSIVYFDGTLLGAEENPFWREGNIRRRDHYDVCIVGGGSGGFGAAYALKDSGYKVCLVERLDSLGGTNLNGGVIDQIASPIGDWYKAICRTGYSSQGFVFSTSTKSIASSDNTEDEFDKLWRGSMLNYSTSDLGNLCTTNPYYFRQAYEDALKETVDILYNREVVDSKVVDGKIASAVFRNVKTGGLETISADYFIDCTADICLLRCNQVEGTDFYIGSDGHLYDETAYRSSAVADRYEINTLEQTYSAINTTVTYGRSGANGRIQRYEADLTQFPSDPDVTSVNINGAYELNYISPELREYFPYPNNYNQVYGETISSGEWADIPSADIIDNGYDYARTVGLRKAMAHAKVRNDTGYIGVTPMLAIRETYRMKCDYMLTQEDIETTITSSNLAEKHIVALSSWYCDIHNPVTLSTGAVSPTWLNGVPYEALIPSCYKNALVACRGLGASHVGAAAFRLIRTMLSVGYAAGKAIEQARANWMDDVRNVDIAVLQSDIGIAETLADIETNILSAQT